MTHRVTLIPGDGVGAEVTAAARRAVEATGVAVRWDVLEASASGPGGLADAVLDSIRANGVAMKGPLETPVEGELRNANVALRVALDLYAGVRPCRWYPGVRSRYRGIDLVVIRENTEDSYTGIEFEQGEPETKELIRFIEEATGRRIREDSGLSIKSISEGASERIVRFAFDYAATNGRARVTAGHKANIMKHSDGVFLEAARRVAAEHPETEFEDRIIDNLTMQLVQRPEAYDVLVLPNLYGDIVSELCAGLVGGPGLAPSANLGEGCAVFETTHGSAARYRGTDRANPMAMMLSAAMMLRHLGEVDAGDRLEAAVAGVLAEGRNLTADLLPDGDERPPARTSVVTDAVVECLEHPERSER